MLFVKISTLVETNKQDLNYKIQEKTYFKTQTELSKATREN